MSPLTSNADVSVPLLQRIGAAWAALLLLVLTLAAASPTLHGWLHCAGVDPDDSCAVVLFASGITAAAAIIAVALPNVAWPVCRATPYQELFFTTPRYLRLPERGPPACYIFTPRVICDCQSSGPSSDRSRAHSLGVSQWSVS